MSLRSYYPKPQKAGGSRFPDRRDPQFLAWIRQQRCCVSGVRSGELIEVPFAGGTTGKVRAIIEAAHVKSRGSGGDDRGNTVPMELSVHRSIHSIGHKTFQRRHGIDLAELAAKYAADFERTHG